VLTVLIAK